MGAYTVRDWDTGSSIHWTQLHFLTLLRSYYRGYTLVVQCLVTVTWPRNELGMESTRYIYLLRTSRSTRINFEQKIIFSAPSHEWHTTSQLLLPARRSQNRMMTSSANRPPSSHRNSQDRRTLKRTKQIPSQLRITEPVDFVVATAP